MKRRLEDVLTILTDVFRRVFKRLRAFSALLRCFKNTPTLLGFYILRFVSLAGRKKGGGGGGGGKGGGRCKMMMMGMLMMVKMKLMGNVARIRHA